MQIHLAEISENEGSRKHYSLPLEMEEIFFQAGVYPIREKKPVELDIENTGRRVLMLTGNTELTMLIPCDRCLTEVSVRIPLMFEQKLDLKQSEQDRIKDLDESSYLTGMDLDVDRLVYLEALMNWPHKVLCRSDCKGLCLRCGHNLNEGSCECTEEPRDPRMAAISDIFSKFKEEV